MKHIIRNLYEYLGLCSLRQPITNVHCLYHLHPVEFGPLTPWGFYCILLFQFSNLVRFIHSTCLITDVQTTVLRAMPDTDPAFHACQHFPFQPQPLQAWNSWPQQPRVLNQYHSKSIPSQNNVMVSPPLAHTTRLHRYHPRW